MIIFYRRFVSLLGVALCAAPMLFLLVPVAGAQQGNEQVRLLSQMQAMQQEIATLRDMVERQAYQIRQLQNANNPSTSRQPGNQVGEQFPSDPAQDASSSQNSVAYGNLPTTSDPQLGNQGEYTPYAGNTPDVGGQQQPGSNEYPVNIEERTIGSVSSPNNNSASGYPPVEERTVSTSQSSQRAPVYNPETYNQEPSMTSQTSQDANDQQAPVLSPEGFPTPYERQEPARVPVVNNIPQPNNSGTTNTPAAGGIITIPPVVESQSNTQASTASVAEQTYYQQGFELLKQSKHDDAVTMFKEQLSDYPDGDYADDAHYWIAESLYVNRNLDQSKLYFKAITDKFAQSPRVPDAMLKTAYIEQEQGNLIEARILLQEIIQFHPRSNAAISAKNRLANLN